MTTYTLPADMTAETAEDTARALASLSLTPETRLTLDVTKVENFTSCGAQILVAIQKTLHANGGHCDLSGKNDYVEQTLHAIGLSWLMQPSPIGE